MCAALWLCACGRLAAQDPFPAPMDWSHKHLIVTNAADLGERMAASRDPRAVSSWLRRTQAQAGAAPGADSARRGHHRSRPKLHRDWSVSLGAGRVAPGMSPAKFGFSITSGASCTTDYAAYGLDVAGATGSQANLVLLRNLYSGSGGLCGSVNIAAAPLGIFRFNNTVIALTTAAHSFTVGMQVAIAGVTDSSFNGIFTVTSVPTATSFIYAQVATNASSGGGTASFASASVMAAYNVTTQAGGRILTSPTISLDGKKIAFVESTPTASIFHVLTLDPCTYSVAGCTSNGTDASSSAAPGVGNAASMVSLTYSNSSNTRSSPWIDYAAANDAAYVGDDNGTLYRITGVFYGTPALDLSFGGSGSLIVNSGTQLTGPVLAQGWLLVGDSTGLLWAMQAAFPYTILGSLQVGGGQSGATLYGIVDPPMVDASTTGVLSAFATSGQSTGGNFTLAQATLNLGTQTFTIARQVNLGSGAGSSLINGRAPAFDNNYYLGNITATTGFIYACGMQAASRHPRLFRIGFTAGAPPTMNAAPNGTLNIGVNSAECSPLTEFANPNLAVNDLLFVGDTSGQVQSFNISGAMPTAAAAGPVAEPGGTSGIVVDTTQLPSQQGSSIYFTTQSNVGGNCGAGNYCAIKLTQAALQ